MPVEQDGPRPPWSERVCDWTCLVFALWTLCCQAVVLAGGTLSALLWCFVLLAPPALWLLAAALRPAPGPAAEPLAAAPEHDLPVLRGVAVLVVSVSMAAWASLDRAVAFWSLGVAVLGFAAFWLLAREQPRLEPAARRRRLELGLWLLAGLCLIVALISHRPDPDDAHYVNLAVSAVDLPDWPLLSSDTLHGVAGVPLVQPAYRFHSYELWNAALSKLTGLPAIYCFHWISLSIGALLVPLAFARLFRLLTPRRWLSAVAVLLVVLVAVGETHRWYGNFALVRMWQGKAFYLSVFLPLIYAYALELSLKPSRRAWILLIAAQVAAVGSSSSAIWGAPLAAIVAMLSALPADRRSLRLLAAGGLACLFALVVGWLLKRSMLPTVEYLEAERLAPGVHLGTALTTVLGQGRLLFFAAAALMLAWAFCPPGLARRFAVGVAFVPLATLLNPFVAHLTAAHVTGPSYWRSLWAVPVPILITLVLLAPWRLDRAGTSRWLGPAVCAALVLAFVAFVPRIWGFSPQNSALRVGWPGLKVPSPEYEVAAALGRSVRPRARVVAPNAVSRWVTTFHRHAYPAQVRNYLTGRILAHLGRENVKTRLAITRYVDRFVVSEMDSEGFRAALEELEIEGVCLRRSERLAEARRVLKEQGYDKVEAIGAYEIWVRAVSS